MLRKKLGAGETGVPDFGMFFSRCPLSYALAYIVSGDLRW
jgi:hypothetical protein